MRLTTRFQILLVVAGCALGGCKQQSVPATTASAAPGQPAAPPDPLSITPNEALRRRLTTGSIQNLAVGEVITVAARVEVDGTRVTRVGSPVMGRVTSLLVHEGQQVEQGQILALVNSTVLSDGQLAFLKALAKGQLALRAVERARVLLKAEVIGAAELQRREAEVAEAEAERDAARDQLLLLGMAPEAVEELQIHRKLNSTARIIASMRGTVLTRKITLGQVLQPADDAFEIADLSSLWLVADVPSPESTALFIGQSVEAEISAHSNTTISGKLTFVSSTVNEATRTVRAHLPLDNASGRYKPAMLATMRLKGRTQPQACVPPSAVVREEDREHVFVESAGSSFTLRPVQLGPELGACRVVLEGLTSADIIVREGAFHLNNERRRRALRSAGGE